MKFLHGLEILTVDIGFAKLQAAGHLLTLECYHISCCFLYLYQLLFVRIDACGYEIKSGTTSKHRKCVP